MFPHYTECNQTLWESTAWSKLLFLAPQAHSSGVTASSKWRCPYFVLQSHLRFLCQISPPPNSHASNKLHVTWGSPADWTVSIFSPQDRSAPNLTDWPSHLGSTWHPRTITKRAVLINERTLQFEASRNTIGSPETKHSWFYFIVIFFFDHTVIITRCKERERDDKEWDTYLPTEQTNGPLRLLLSLERHLYFIKMEIGIVCVTLYGLRHQ